MATFPVLWPIRENYELFRGLCDDDLPRSLDGYISLWGATETYLDKLGGEILKVPFDPIVMAEWCRDTFDVVNEEARAAYARRLVAIG